MTKLYIIGSMQNKKVPDVANILRLRGFEAFDDWHSSGPESDEFWRKYEEGRGRSYVQALEGLFAQHVFNFDLRHLREADAAILCCPAGRSAYLEFGWMLGQGKSGFALVEEDPERWDVMLQFATEIVSSVDDLCAALDDYYGSGP